MRNVLTLTSVLAVVVVLISSKADTLGAQLLRNGVFLGTSHIYTGSLADGADRIELIQQVWNQSCSVFNWDACAEEGNVDTGKRLQEIDRLLIDPPSPLLVLSSQSDQALNLNLFRVGGESKANQLGREQVSRNPQEITLWGRGFIEARLFSFESVPVKLAIEAQHDDPPPVLLEVDLDGTTRSPISYSKGDQSWEVQITDGFYLHPGFHHLRIWFTNDYTDASLHQDRNAHIKSVVLQFPKDVP